MLSGWAELLIFGSSELRNEFQKSPSAALASDANSVQVIGFRKKVEEGRANYWDAGKSRNGKYISGFFTIGSADRDSLDEFGTSRRRSVEKEGCRLEATAPGEEVLG